MAEEEVRSGEQFTAALGEVAPVWFAVGDARIDANAITAMRSKMVLREHRSALVTEVHLQGTVMDVDVRPATFLLAWQTALGEQPAPGAVVGGGGAIVGVDREVVDHLTAVWRDSNHIRSDVTDRWPALALLLDQLADLSPTDG
jgi:hypothetical protein